MDELSERDAAILAFEREWWTYAGTKDEQIRQQLDMTAMRYYQLLNRVIDDPAALARDPLTVKRLQRLRVSRQRHRQAQRLGFEV